MKMPIIFLLVLSFFSGARKIKTFDDANGDTSCLVQFTILNAGIEVAGTISVVWAQVKFDSDERNPSSISAMANPSTIQTGIPIRDKHLKRSDYFDVERYSSISLTSQSIRKDGKNKFKGVFDLTMKGKTEPVIIHFKATYQNGVAIYRGEFEINRLDFDLGEKSLILDEKVKVTVEAKTIVPK